jgi:hypothetical protein
MKMTQEQKAKATEFKRELKALLEKYDGSIEFRVDDSSDTHGIYGDELNVYMGKIEVASGCGWSLGPKDIEI